MKRQFFAIGALCACSLAAVSGFAGFGIQPREKPVQTGYTTVDGLKMYYEIWGKGDRERLVLLHGAFMTIDLNWGKMIPPLSKNRQVIAAELQGARLPILLFHS